MPRIVRFDHVSTYTNDDLNIHHDAAGKVTVGQATPIDITVHNTGDVEPGVHVRLYWCGPNAGAPALARTYLSSGLFPAPDAAGVPLQMPPIGGSSTTGVIWTPDPAILGTTTQAHGCLFAQLSIDAIPLAGYPDPETHPDDWNPNSPLNAQHNIELVQAAKGTKSVKFAIGVGHPFSKEIATTLRVTPIRLGDTQLLQALKAKKKFAKVVRQARLVEPATPTLVMGAERLIAQNIPVLAAPKGKRVLKAAPALPPALRLGHTGLLTDAVAKMLANSRVAANHKLALIPNELRQAIVEIPIPRNAQKGDLIGAVVVNEATTAVGKARPAKPQLIGGVAVVVQIV
jgi:hypothetical protein